MLFYPPCKVNLGLQVLNKRPDGYHNINTVMIPIKYHDIIEIVPAHHFSFSSSGVEFETSSGDNLCIKAYHLFQEKTNATQHFQLHLHKQIPIGSGLGGGSSDAAYTLLALNALRNNILNQSELKQLATQLGSDCPFFLHSVPQYCTGRGEIMENIFLQLDGYWITLFFPGIFISTAEAYQHCIPQSHEQSTKNVVQKSIHLWKDNLTNDFEGSIFTRYPTLKLLKEELYQAGATYASLSGSGSTVYGLFKEKPILRELGAKYPKNCIIQL